MIFAYIKRFFNHVKKSQAELYLEDAADMIDLENRIRLLDRGQAPFQVYERNYQNIYLPTN